MSFTIIFHHQDGAHFWRQENKSPNKGLQTCQKVYAMFQLRVPHVNQEGAPIAAAAAVPCVLDSDLFNDTPEASSETLKRSQVLCNDSKVAATVIQKWPIKSARTSGKENKSPKVAATVIQKMARTSGILKVAATAPGILPQVLHGLCYTKWSINQYYCKMLPDGEAFSVSNRKNLGSGICDIDVSKLTRLLEDHKNEMSPLQIVACFIFQHIHKLSHKTQFVLGLVLTCCHHGVPVANDGL